MQNSYGYSKLNKTEQVGIEGILKMKYVCKIVDVVDDEVTIKIGTTFITGFVNCGTTEISGAETKIDIILYDDLQIMKTEEHKLSIERKANTFQYTIWGILDIENAILHSTIDFDIGRDELFDYGHLDGKFVKVNVIRIDFIFDR